MVKIINIGTFTLIPTLDSSLYVFSSAIDKHNFVHTRDVRGYELIGNFARLYLFIVVDTDGSGWCLTPKSGVTLEEAKQLIKQYL